MPKERSAGAVVMHRGKQIEYLLLLYPGLSKKSKKYWDFPKGHIEKGETEQDTIIREVREETGINNLNIFPKFRNSIKYYFQKEGKTIFKTVAFYIAESRTKSVKISSEHLDFIWLPYKQALDAMAHINAKRVLRRANGYIIRR
ncbi:MAG: NUDIX domain-containing protein [Candidatus Paceibacterota bacterium]|jgi:8-oxo-dGTP pyrophosphatase MutT (NUDIX family)|nr:NUDIX domain-containing protein [Candidatus Paceibacterota bacterium]MDD5621122.1 NUDIX domain-containing protein [Candidatus Paceibacterota bacterium]